MQEIGLNICDIQRRVLGKPEIILGTILDSKKLDNVSRLYVGSYYCSNYFLQTPKNGYRELLLFAKRRGLKVTLVIPPLFEKDLKASKELLLYLKSLSIELENIIDEVSINDLGMLELIQKETSVEIFMGRLLQKDNRDPRYSDFYVQKHVPRTFNDYYKKFITENGISGIEIDCTHETIEIPDALGSTKVAVHKPYCYMSLGSICEFASISKPDNKKFRFADSCKCECDSAFIECIYSPENTFERIGRSVQFENGDCEICSAIPYRLIYTPIAELLYNAF